MPWIFTFFHSQRLMHTNSPWFIVSTSWIELCCLYLLLPFFPPYTRVLKICISNVSLLQKETRKMGLLCLGLQRENKFWRLALLWWLLCFWKIVFCTRDVETSDFLLAVHQMRQKILSFCSLLHDVFPFGKSPRYILSNVPEWCLVKPNMFSGCLIENILFETAVLL